MGEGVRGFPARRYDEGGEGRGKERVAGPEGNARKGDRRVERGEGAGGAGGVHPSISIPGWLPGL